MLQNYLTTAWRNIIRNKLFSAINMAGLSLGLACVMLIVLYTKDELSFDRFHENGPNIYRIVSEYSPSPGAPGQSSGNSGMVQGPGFMEDIPEMKSLVRMQSDQITVRIGTELFEQEGLFVDEDFFSMFSFPLLSGRADKALVNMHSIVISETVARRLFGSVDAVGKTAELSTGSKGAFEQFTVTGVTPNSPKNSSIQIQLLMPMKLNERNGGDPYWTNFFLNSFVLIQPGADIMKLEKKMNQVYLAKAKAQLAEQREKYNENGTYRWGLQRMRDIHLSTQYTADNGLKFSSNPIYSRILGGIALFILVIACINFVNLSVARSLKRAREVGIRKVIGGERRQLVVQFLLESAILSFLAFALAVVITQFSLPVFNHLADKSLALSYLFDAKLLILYLGLFLCTTLLAGFYPALVLSGFNPVKTLYNRTRFAGKNYLSQGLVVLQFTLTTFLIICTITIYRQFDFLTTRELGYNDKNLVTVRASQMKAQQVNLFKNELLKNPGIQGVTARQRGTWTTIAKVNNENFDFTIEIVEPGFLPLLQVPIVKGRNLSSDFPSDSIKSVVINEAFAKKAGWDNPIGQQVDFFYDSLKYNVVGVIRNYHHQSLLSEISPQLFTMSPKYSYGTLFMRIKPENQAATLKFIEDVFHRLEPNLPFQYQFKEENNQEQYESEARWKDIISFAALITIFISCIGLFGLATLAAEKRIKEIGIRKVLGASVESITALLSKHFVGLVLLASFVAFPLAWLSLNQWLENYPFRVDLNLWIFGAAGLLVMVLALSTVSFQAIKAALANPVKSLRTE